MQEITRYYAFQLLDMGRAQRRTGSYRRSTDRLARLGLRHVRFYDARTLFFVVRVSENGMT